MVLAVHSSQLEERYTLTFRREEDGDGVTPVGECVCCGFRGALGARLWDRNDENPIGMCHACFEMSENSEEYERLTEGQGRALAEWEELEGEVRMMRVRNHTPHIRAFISANDDSFDGSIFVGESKVWWCANHSDEVVRGKLERRARIIYNAFRMIDELED